MVFGRRLTCRLQFNCVKTADSYKATSNAYTYSELHRQLTSLKVRSSLVAIGNVKAALRLVSEQTDSGCLVLDDIQPDGESVKKHLQDKHPPGCPATVSALSKEPPAPQPHPVIYDQIDGPLVRATVQGLSGSAGPSGFDAKGWKRVCSSFHSTSDDLCTAIARATRRLCSSYIDPEGISALVACRLIALDKKPGIRPIGIGETLRRLMAKTILRIAQADIQCAVGSLQLCAGQEAACEAGIHAIRNIFNDEDTEAVLLVDATNAFNALNRQVALRNIRILCPILAPFLINTYRSPSKLFIEGVHILSQEGITQGDPLGMAMFAIGTLPLIQQIRGGVRQSWYADDATAGGTITTLRDWWDRLQAVGPSFGYHPNPSKTWLVVKADSEHRAEESFQHTGIKITTQGSRFLGAALGTRSFVEKFVRDKVAGWVTEVKNLSVMAKTHPQAAYAVFTHGQSSKWIFLMRTIPDIGALFQPLEDAIRQFFLPAITGRQAMSETERELLALPPRLGGLGIPNPTKSASSQFRSSKRITEPLAALILRQSQPYPEATIASQKTAKAAVRTNNRTAAQEEAEALRPRLPKSQQFGMDQASEKGASCWLTTLPIQEYGFSLHKQAFRDALCVRYGWQLERLPSHCACGETVNLNHALSCSKGAMPSIRHNCIRDLLAQFLTEVCPNVAIEPALQPLTGETFPHRSTNTDDGARLDVKAQNFWDSSRSSAFFDVRVFNSHAPSNCKTSTAACYRRHELEKRRAYERRIIEVERGSFTPIVLSTSGGWGPSATVAFRRLAGLLSIKHSQPYSTTLGFIRCKITFSLIESTIMCLRGARSSFHNPAHNTIGGQDCPLDLITNEARLLD